jgi:hypothetical protein
MQQLAFHDLSERVIDVPDDDPLNGQVLYSVELCYWLVRIQLDEVGKLGQCGA